ncbi:two-component system response regulator YesN [Halanaerobium saccharolyticum]|uniref:Stage 0 sporulation protein A homolog n=1 Tax=Halanaerobium saccharolyticum TaxID=43595 RepID=A0A4R7Z091_9FIRM|nr:helix-turn-helix domain-containing protein [Halanaerobium saccharolyticum]RAK07196.1 two-component system response regulator YesN [Halanaerobium saccharolyticum]TDW02109.1 two-component system response regulator YesN [Halanaerobium saccharolyticum]TDX58840.1 two-component system response regulator YesN [Halanaerobium saccharolyticum]
MLKVMIVEDDIFDYTHLKNIIDWNQEGFQISEQIKNVEAAQKKLEEERFDIIISDMKMPGKSGADLIKYIAENYPEIKSIALSGYKEFDYVKKSLKAGAEDYILKHELKKDSLISLLTALRIKIEQNKEDKNSDVFEESFFLDQKNILIQNFAEKLVRGYFNNKNDLKKQIELLSINFELKNIVITIGQFDNYQDLQQKYTAAKLLNIKRSFINMADEILKENGKSFAVLKDEKNFLFLFSFRDNSELKINNSTASAINRIKSALKNYLNITASFAVSNILHNPLEIAKSYNQTAELLEDKFYQGKDMIIYQNQNNRIDNQQFNLDIKREKLLLKYIEKKDSTALKNELENLFNDIARIKPGLSVLKMTLISLINIINSSIKDKGLRGENIFEEKGNPYQKLEELNSLTEFKDWIIKIYINLVAELKDKNNYSNLINQTLLYIDKNYDQDLTLGQVAAEIGVSYSYLSRKFKEECGQGFSDYLNQLRIKKAKKMITEGKRNIKEIVSQVGFNNYNYFFKVFKDFEGITPSEYERKNK